MISIWTIILDALEFMLDAVLGWLPDYVATGMPDKAISFVAQTSAIVFVFMGQVVNMNVLIVSITGALVMEGARAIVGIWKLAKSLIPGA